MRYLAIGDVHGYSHVLRKLVELVQPQSEDLIITLGDYVDRGPDSKGVLDYLIEQHKTGQWVSLRGNHDVMMMNTARGQEYLREWLLCGGKAALASYGDPGLLGTLTDVPQEHWEFLISTCLDWYEIHSHFFVHANVYPDVELDEQPLHQLHWEPLLKGYSSPHCSGKIMVCGHTCQKSGRPLNLGHAVCIDTWVYGNGWLTCLDVESGRYWQVSKSLQQRTGYLEDPS